MSPIDETIANAVEQRADRIAETLCDLVRFPSIVKSDPREAGPGELDCQLYLQKRLEALGFTTDLWEPNGPALYAKYEGRPGANKGRAFEGWPNLAGVLKGNGEGRPIMLTDISTLCRRARPNTGGAIRLRRRFRRLRARPRRRRHERRGRLHADGDRDSQRDRRRPRRRCRFTTVVDEEIGGMGSLAMVDRADAAIMTEPTANRIAPLRHGILWGRIIVDGIGGHAELTPNYWDGNGPVDAIELCRQVLDGIDIFNRRWRMDRVKNHPLMDLPNQIIVTQIKAGEHPSSTAGRGEIVIDVRYLPHEKDEFGLGGQVKREVETHLAAVSQADPYLRKHPPRIEWILDADCAEVPADHPFVAAFQGATSRLGSTLVFPVLARTATSVRQPASAIPLNPISPSSAWPSAISWTARRRSPLPLGHGAGVRLAGGLVHSSQFTDLRVVLSPSLRVVVT